MKLYENTFVTLSEADNYFSDRPNSELWYNLTEIQKEQALIFASIKINNFVFIGEKKDKKQKLEFPRNFDPELPLEIKFAVCEEAVSIVENSVHHKNKKLGIKSMVVGSTDITYKDEENLGILISKDALIFVSKWTRKNFDIN